MALNRKTDEIDNSDVKKPTNYNADATLDNLDFSFLYRAALLNENGNPYIDEQKLKYEIIRAIASTHNKLIKNGQVTIYDIDGKTFNTVINVEWNDGKTEAIKMKVEVKV